MIKKKNLEMTLSGIPPAPEPKSHLEQYPTPAPVAADVLYFAHSQGDITDKKVMDLGCGTGIFTLGAKLLGAREVVGVDIDEASIDIGRKLATKLGLDVDFKVCEVEDFKDEGDCVVQNPPFGAQSKHADRPFIQKALELSNVVYSLHLTKTDSFIEKIAKQNRASITHRLKYDFEIKHTFSFHTKEKRYFDVTMYRLLKNEGIR
jgi:putative methylase